MSRPLDTDELAVLETLTTPQPTSTLDTGVLWRLWRRRGLVERYTDDDGYWRFRLTLTGWLSLWAHRDAQVAL